MVSPPRIMKMFSVVEENERFARYSRWEVLDIVSWTVALIENISKRGNKMFSYAEDASPAPDCVETMTWIVAEPRRVICSEPSETRSLEFDGILERDVFSNVNLLSDNAVR